MGLISTKLIYVRFHLKGNMLISFLGIILSSFEIFFNGLDIFVLLRTSNMCTGFQAEFLAINEATIKIRQLPLCNSTVHICICG